MAEHFLFVRGEIDLASAPALRADLRRVIASDNDDVVVDCFDMTFMDMSGVRVLMWARGELQARGRGFRIKHLRPTIQRIFDIVGVSVSLNVVLA